MITVRDRLTCLGCALVAAALLFTGIWLMVVTRTVAQIAALGLVAILVLLLLIPGAILLNRWNIARAARAFRLRYGAEGRDLLIVYTASPHWQPYIEANWLARWRERIVLLNRSDPDWQKRPEATLWRRVAGPIEHTPMAIVVAARGRPRVVRFYSAFRDYKHGRSRALEAKERELETALATSRDETG